MRASNQRLLGTGRRTRVSAHTTLVSAYRTNSAAARRTARAAAYTHTAHAVAQPALPSYFADREQYPDPLPRERSPDLHPESRPSAPRTAFPRALSAVVPDHPTAEASRCARLTPPSHVTNPLLPVLTLQSRNPRARAASLFRASRHSPARTPQSGPLQIQARAEPSLRRSRLRPLPSYLQPQSRRPASSTPGYSPSSISMGADRICQTRHQPLEGPPPAAHRHFSKSQSEPNRALRGAEFRPAAAESALRSR